MKRIYFILACFILLVSACQKFDDIALWNMANNQEERLTALEELCSQMNTNIQALRDLIGASNDGDYILNVSPVLKEEIEIGYSITFAKSGTITIYHGKDGGNGTGATPAIGLKQNSDGIYYWTLDNEWLLDGSGKKVRASAMDGQDGKTPKLKIENGRWLLSMDNGNTWEDAGQATGDNGQNGSDGNSIFKKVDYTTSNEYVIFTLADNTELKLPKYGQGGGGSTGKLSITFSETTDILVEPFIDYEITYTISGADNNTTVKAIGLNGFMAEVKVNSPTSGKIIITPSAPSIIMSVQQVMIVVSNEEHTAIEVLTFRYKENTWNIIIPDINFKTYLVENFDLNHDDEISYSEALQVTEIRCTTKNIQTLEGIQYFLNLTRLECYRNNLTSLDVSKNTALKELWCTNNNLTSLDVSKNTVLEVLACDNNNLTSLDVSKNTALKKLECFENDLTSLDVSKNTALELLRCENNNLTSLDVSKNTALEIFYCSSTKLTSLDVSKNTALKELWCDNNNLTSLDVSKNTALECLVCTGTNLTSLDVSKNTALYWLGCQNNNFSDSALNQIFKDLPQGKTWTDSGSTRQSTIYIKNNPGATACDKSIATNKGWRVEN